MCHNNTKPVDRFLFDISIIFSWWNIPMFLYCWIFILNIFVVMKNLKCNYKFFYKFKFTLTKVLNMKTIT